LRWGGGVERRLKLLFPNLKGTCPNPKKHCFNQTCVSTRKTPVPTRSTVNCPPEFPLPVNREKTGKNQKGLNFHEKVPPEVKHPVCNLHIPRMQALGDLQNFSRHQKFSEIEFSKKFVA